MVKIVNAKPVKAKSTRVKPVKAAPKEQTAEQFLEDIENRLTKEDTAQSYFVEAEIGDVCSSFETGSLDEANRVISGLISIYMFNKDNRDFYIYFTTSDGKALSISEA